jgi:Na+/H+ antiporter NhaD/arsenite permease-like protein
MRAVSGWLDANIHSTYLLSVVLGLLSAVMDNIVLVLSAVNIYPVLSPEEAVTPYLQNFMQNGQYWHLVALSGNIGGCLLPIGSIAGLALMKSEDVTIWWWFRRITLGAFIGWACALGTYFLVDYFLR